MGVYINGMEMPKSCFNCRCPRACQAINRRIDEIDRTEWFPQDHRHSDCPLIEVSEPHGRLGDLNELYNHLREWYLTHEHGFLGNEKIYISAMLSGVKDSPTVIPASEEV